MPTYPERETQEGYRQKEKAILLVVIDTTCPVDGCNHYVLYASETDTPLGGSPVWNVLGNGSVTMV